MNREKMIEAITTAILGKTAPKAAAVVLDLCGPKKLDFVDERGDGVLTSFETGRLYRIFPQETGEFFASHCGFYPTLETAQAAAQADAYAAHWANTVIGASQ